jgi:hypothetical protein
LIIPILRILSLFSLSSDCGNQLVPWEFTALHALRGCNVLIDLSQLLTTTQAILIDADNLMRCGLIYDPSLTFRR